MVALDPRIHPFRPEVAARYLKGQVEAERFVEGTRYQVIEPTTFLRRAASHEARLDSEVLLGERVIVYEITDEGWAWGQLERDGYVGWLPASALGAPGLAPTHKVCVPRTLCFPAPDIKLPPLAALAMGATLSVARQDERFAITASGWHVPEVHLAPVKAISSPLPNSSSAHPIFGAARPRSASTAPDWCRWRCRLRAMPARATATCRNWRSASWARSPKCGAAI
jgi:Bacterial dipeptidyl-peptidase Sh3 domain